MEAKVHNNNIVQFIDTFQLLRALSLVSSRVVHSTVRPGKTHCCFWSLKFPVTYYYGFLMFVAYKSLILPFAVVEHGNNFSILATIESFFFSLTSVI